MTSVWMVTEGDYSDYHVLVIAMSEAEAQEWVDAYKAANVGRWSDASIEEMELYQSGDPLPKKWIGYGVDQMGRDFEYSHVSVSHRSEPRVANSGRGFVASDYPTPESARKAWNEAQK